MSNHETFHFHSLADLRAEISREKLDLPVSDRIDNLLEPYRHDGLTLANRLVVLPMEGCDGLPDGSPDELTFRRYQRFASGGAGLMWVEATAVVPEGRANPRQLWIHNNNVPAFARLVETIHKEARDHNGAGHRPLLVVQLTHSGRYSKPGRRPQPVIAHHSYFLDPLHRLPADYPLISDEALEQLEERYVEAALCAQRAGFDGVDVKACHRYLISELLASHTRAKSRYGGAFENRTRLLRNIVAKIRAVAPQLRITTRLNVYDAMAYPFGFGVDRMDPAKPDLEEPIQLVRSLQQAGVSMVNVTIGNPYYNPHVNRPFDLPTAGAPIPSEPPLHGVARFVNIVRQMQTAVPELTMIGGGYSWLRQFFPHAAAASVDQGWVTLVGTGRLSFAYPDFARDLQEWGKLNPQKVCVACSACTQIMRDGGRTGCVPRDAAVYEPIYKQGRLEALDTIIHMAKTCRQCNDPACVGRCPAQVNIPRFVAHIAAGRMREAYETIREANVLATVCGYVCPAETLCESGCINQHYTASVPIQQLQRWVSRQAVDEGWVGQPIHSVEKEVGRVAIVGAGPAGVAAATVLVSLGYQVTLMDRHTEPGGMARDTIPMDRLPDSVLKAELRQLLDACNANLERRQVHLSSSYTLDQIAAEGYDAILLTCGLGKAATLPNSQRPATGVIGALEFLSQVKRGQTITGKVLVLGGGNTALDAAVASKQAGVTDVSVVYRRSFAEMPAWPQERDRAVKAGVHLLTLTAPLEYLAHPAGRLAGLRVIRTQLGEPDARGRRTAQPIPGTEHTLPADWVIEAFGQQMEDDLKAALNGVRLNDRGLVWTHSVSLATSRPGVFVAGDLVNGGSTVVQAVAEGTRAARELHQWLRAKQH